MMKILVTGARGFVGRNLTAFLECIRDGKDRAHRICAPAGRDGEYSPENLEIAAYDVDSEPEELEAACRDCSFVFHLAGVNRPKEKEEFMEGNFGFSSVLLNLLRKYKNTCPIFVSSSIQASLTGRFKDSEYGKSKLAGEKLFLEYSRECGAQVFIYRLPNLFGKWCRPNYNSAVATFCYNTANDLPLVIHDRNTELELLYIDDLLEEMLCALNGKGHRCSLEEAEAKADENGVYCYAPVTHRATLGEIADLLESFRQQPKTLLMPEIPSGSFAKKLYSVYLSYLPEKKASFPLKMNADERGSFTELLKTKACGQFSVNISRPGITKGEHWHHTKWELFIVVSGQGLIRQRRIGTDENGNPYPILEFPVSGEKIEAVHMLPGYTHSIVNCSETKELITLMWANEAFDPEKPDTFAEPVGIQKEEKKNGA